MRTSQKGIFPLAHVVDVDYNDFDPASVEERKERYLLDYLGSVQCAQKGAEIIIQVNQKLKRFLFSENNLLLTKNDQR